MGLSLTHSARQTKILNHTMVQAFKITRMDKTELLEHLSSAAENNPFLEITRPDPDLPSSRPSGNGGYIPENASDVHKSLYRQITDQLPLVLETDHESQIAQILMMELEPSGWLGRSLDEISAIYGFAVSDCRHVLKRLQTLEPAGLFARNLKECLRLQALDRDQLDEIMEGLISRLEELLDCDIATMANRLNVDPADVAHRLYLIRRMNPKPGSAFEIDETLSRQSDVILNIENQDLVIELTKSSFPSIRLLHAEETAGQSALNLPSRLNELVREAKSLKNSLEYRNSTTLAVIEAIFARQRDFLKHGYAALSPMSMSEIADDLGVSEATVSRVVTGLTIQCPHGNIGAKSLFCQPVTYCGQPTTRHVAFQMIKKLVDGEDRKSPLSDGEIATKAKSHGFSVSRRTVAKYRNILGIRAPQIRRKNAELSGLIDDHHRTGFRHATRC
ncbi:RNA polymerase factor sigma-54 [Ruegeria hyattellae]|uniref:RNA polymerase factor sigma-54 n=1 Tax=Ruegeria hyattellae TaxID=3233337 RepID=UPI00355B2144